MFYLFDQFNKFYHYLAQSIADSLNWYAVVLFFFFIYMLVNYIFKKFFIEKEQDKKTKITKQIEELKKNMSYQNDDKMDLSKKIENVMITQPKEEDVAFQKRAHQIIKENNGKPHISLLLQILQAIIFISFLYYFRTVDVITMFKFLPYITAILTFFALVTRKMVILYFIVAIVIFYIFKESTVLANIFMSLNFFVMIIERKIIPKIKSKNEL